MKYLSKSGKFSETISSPKKAWNQYRLSMVGDRSLTDFIIFEFLTMFIAPFPLRIGIKLRQLTSSFILGGFGHNVELERDITLRRPKQIKIGDGVKISTGCILDLKNDDGSIEIGNKVSIGQKTIFNCINGNIYVADNTRIGEFARLGSLQGLKIGQNCVIGNYTYLSGAAHAFNDPKLPIIKQPLTCRGTTEVGNNVVIGEHVTVNDGVHIGNHVEIAPGSFINTDIPSNAYAVGVPAKYYINDKWSEHV